MTAAIAQAEREGQGALHFVAFDLGEIEEIPALVSGLRKEFGPIFGLVNNAALGTDGALAMMHNARIEAMVHVNTLAPIVFTKYVVRAMMADGAGRIVNVASISASPATAGLPPMRRPRRRCRPHPLAGREVGRFGVTVNAVTPAFWRPT